MHDWILGASVLTNLTLLGFLAAVHCFYLKQIQILLNKLMSRSYMDYQVAQKKEPRVDFKLDPDTPDDLRVLQGISS